MEPLVKLLGAGITHLGAGFLGINPAPQQSTAEAEMYLIRHYDEVVG